MIGFFAAMLAQISFLQGVRHTRAQSAGIRQGIASTSPFCNQDHSSFDNLGVFLNSHILRACDDVVADSSVFYDRGQNLGCASPSVNTESHCAEHRHRALMGQRPRYPRYMEHIIQLRFYLSTLRMDGDTSERTSPRRNANPAMATQNEMGFHYHPCS